MGVCSSECSDVCKADLKVGLYESIEYY